MRRAGGPFRRVCELLTENSGRERTTAFVYSVGWTQHTVGVQYIRTASILQALLGNIGRPGGGILALRGHASIQGSTDIPTLFDLLPGYIPMPHAHANQDLDSFVEAEAATKGYWANMRAYTVSLLKAWWGEAATAGNDFCFDYLPRLTGSHSTYETVMAQLAGNCPRLFPVRREPGRGVGEHQDAAARHGEAGLAGRAGLLAHRERHLVERRPGDRDRGNAHRRTSAPRCSSCRPPRTPRRTAASPTPSACCSGITRRSSPAATPAATCGSPTTSAAGSGRSWPARPMRWTGRCRT